MKLLIWVAPWAAHGDLQFYKNAVQKHLIPQGNILSNEGWEVDLFLPESLSFLQSNIDKKINVIDFTIEDQLFCFGCLNDLSGKLYENKDLRLIESISDKIKKYLESYYDVILLWETPVPFLEKIYPDSLIVHQMPGVFSRLPYPHTITFDPWGLYNNSSLTQYSKVIMSGVTTSDENKVAEKFKFLVESAIEDLQPFSRHDLDFDNKYKKLLLVPLQVSAHYAFQTDTSYSNQMDFLLDVMKDVDSDTGVVVTQYVTPRVSDTIIDNDTLHALRKKWPNIIYNPIFDKINGISQYILPHVDNVATCSSSMGMQAVVLNRDMKTYGNTFLSPYSYENLNKNLMNDYEYRENILSYILNRNQPLASSITKDGQFLSKLLKRLYDLKRSGNLKPGNLPSFNSIDSEYHDKLFNQFNTGKAAEQLIAQKICISTKTELFKKFSRFVNDKEVEIISFDVFDTLVYRPTEVPVDLFKLMNSKVFKLTNGIIEDFSKIRQSSEVEARKDKNGLEITLTDIYKKIQDIYDLETNVINSIKALEIETELSLIRPREFGKKLWEIAKKTKKPIIIISDMYLSSNDISLLLERTGYNGYSKIYVSSEYGQSKKNGALFDLILNELKVSAGAVLHIGDNKIADNEQPKSRGIRSYRLLRAIERLRMNEYYSHIYPAKRGANELSRTVLAGLTAAKLFDTENPNLEKKTHFQGQPFNLGYAGLGPLILGYMLWLGRNAKKDNISKLYFLAREGWLLKQVYDILHSTDENAVPSYYLYASRRATRVAGLKNISDIIVLAGHPYQSGVTVGNLLSARFGVEANKISPDYFKQAGFTDENETLNADPQGRAKFIRLCRIISEVILTHAKMERRDYMNYLESTGFIDEPNPAVVDIGWRANMQGALASLTNKNILGYYYATLQGTERWLEQGLICRAYMGESLSANHPSVVVKNRALCEYLICHTEPSLVSISRKKDKFIPLFREDLNIGNRRVLLESIHRGTMLFAKDFIESFGSYIDSIRIDPFLAESALSSFIVNPTREDALLLRGHQFEDALGGVANKFVITSGKKNHETNSVWLEGAKIVYFERKSDNNKKTLNAIIDKKNITAQKTNEKKDENNLRNNQEGIKLRYKIERVLVKNFLSQKKYKKYVQDRNLF
ncbi:TPA: HAD-IA family hydrolase, partial [Escherichia coli]|nr:HAD-IA family hydrolase [Escherichia coli]